MQTAAAIARVLQIREIRINYHFCEWMSEMFFVENWIPKLMVRRPDEFPREMLVREYLGGVEYIEEHIGFDEAMTYYPESQLQCKERNRRLIGKLCAEYHSD